MLARASGKGYLFNVGIEPEFFLVVKNPDGSIRGWDPHQVDDLAKPCYDYKGISGALGFLRELNDGLNRLGWGVYQSDHEDANFQYEVNFRYADALATADRLTFFRMMAGQLAQRSGRSRPSWPSRSRAAPAPVPTCTITWPTRRPASNLFLDESDRRGLGLSTLAYHFIGGVLDHAPALCAVTSPTVNCYKRLQMGPALTGSLSGYTWTPAFISYGDNNRTQMLRVPEGGHVEDRSISSAVQPLPRHRRLSGRRAGRHRPPARSRRAQPRQSLHVRPRNHGPPRRAHAPSEPPRGPGSFRARRRGSRKLGPDRRRAFSPQARRVARVSRAGRVVGDQALPDGTLSRPSVDLSSGMCWITVMEHIEAKHVIIGAGAMGSAAAYHLARRGEPVVLIEQFALGHDRGSSHGAARITRHSYADPRYARLMPAAFRAWRELEADAGEALYIRTGGVSFSPPEVDYAAQVAANLEELGVPHWRGSGRAWNQRHPVFALPDRYDVVFEPDAGMLRAARAVALQVELARLHGRGQTRVIEQLPGPAHRSRARSAGRHHRRRADRRRAPDRLGRCLGQAALALASRPSSPDPPAGALLPRGRRFAIPDRPLSRFSFSREQARTMRFTACRSFRAWV